jgi:hypothetical protein
MTAGRLRPSAVTDVIRYDNVDVSAIEPFLSSEDELIRHGAAKIIGSKGDISKLIPVALKEESILVLTEILLHVGKRKDKVEELAGLLATTDSRVRDQAIAMFRTAGRADCMIPLLFGDDDVLVGRVKKYMEAQDDDSEDEASN